MLMLPKLEGFTVAIVLLLGGGAASAAGLSLTHQIAAELTSTLTTPTPPVKATTTTTVPAINNVSNPYGKRKKFLDFLSNKREWDFGIAKPEYGNDTLEHLLNVKIAEVVTEFSLIAAFTSFGAFLVCICCPTCILRRQLRNGNGHRRKPLVVKVMPNRATIETSFSSVVAAPSQRRTSGNSQGSGRVKFRDSCVGVEDKIPPTILETVTVNVETSDTPTVIQMPSEHENDSPVSQELGTLIPPVATGLSQGSSASGYQELDTTSEDVSRQDPPPPYPGVKIGIEAPAGNSTSELDQHLDFRLAPCTNSMRSSSAVQTGDGDVSGKESFETDTAGVEKTSKVSPLLKKYGAELY